MIEDPLAGPHRATSAQTAYVYVVASVVAVGGFLFGYDLAIIGGAILYLKKAFALNDVQAHSHEGGAPAHEGREAPAMTQGRENVSGSPTVGPMRSLLFAKLSARD